MAGKNALDTLQSGLSGGGTDIPVANSVYLGQVTTPATTTKSPTGTTYNVSARTSDKVMTIADAKKSFYSWTDAELNSFKKKLTSFGFKNVSDITAATMWDMAVDGASTWYVNSNGARKISPEQYIQWYAKSQGMTGSNAPQVSKNVYLYDKAQVNDLITKTVTDTLGRDATKDEMDHFYTVIQNMINEGTVTTTKTVKGVNVTTTKPGFTTEAAQAKIKEELKTNSAQDYNEKKSLEFGDFLAKLG